MPLGTVHPVAAPAVGAVLVAGCAGCAALGGLIYATVAPRCRFWGDVVDRGSSSSPARCAITFDDGPCAQATPAILDLLGEMRVKAAFFVVGCNAEKHPHVIRRIHDEGHIVANHSYAHSHYAVMRFGGYWERELRRTDDLISTIIGVRPALFRPPMGVKTPHIVAAVRRNGHTLITWTRRGMDGVATTPQRIVDRLAQKTQAGDILLLHDGIEPNHHRDPSVTIAALRPLVQKLRQRRVEPVRLDDLIGVQAYAPTSEPRD